MTKEGSRSRKAITIFMAGVLFGVLTSVTIAPHVKRTDTVPVAVGSVGPQPGGSTGPIPSGSVAPGVSTAPVPGSQPPPAGVSCDAAHNGGATAPGVTANSIKLATTTVQSGPGAAFLGEVKLAMEAVKNKVNQAGGICGRLLDIQYVDDGWDPTRGSEDLRNFIKGGVFAIPVGASSEGLRIVIDSHDIDSAGIPVVGTDGMLLDQYRDPWVWSVAVATASTARIMAIDAYKRGARRFSIVFDKNYRFGVEAAKAYNDEVHQLTGKDVAGFNTSNDCEQSYCGIIAAQPSYSTEVQGFQPGDYVAMFLEPTTALTWMSTPGAPSGSGPSAPPKGIGGAQPLFTYDFANNCQTACDQMKVWTSYKPPIERYQQDPAVRAFVSDMGKTAPNADINNAFSEGGYIGMTLLVDALKAVGPYLTRDRLRNALESLRFQSGLSLQSTLDWSPGHHFANTTMQAFTINYKGTLNGWRTGEIVSDPTPERQAG